MQKLPKMHRYNIPVWNRHLRPEYIDQISFPQTHLFLQVLQEGMNLYRFEEHPRVGTCCFLQIVPYVYESGRTGHDLFFVSLLQIQDSESAHRLLVKLTEAPLDSFITEDDWSKRLEENLR